MNTIPVIPPPPDWLALAVGVVFFVVIPLSVWAGHLGLTARRRRHAERQARDEAPDYGELAGDEWARWLRLSWSLRFGAPAAEPGRERAE